MRGRDTGPGAVVAIPEGEAVRAVTGALPQATSAAAAVRLPLRFPEEAHGLSPAARAAEADLSQGFSEAARAAEVPIGCG